ncbi:MAG TPA: BCR, YitT family protein, partial [Bacilli bacterium]|nr:BCR, YitT family protein [Bacilli bacterium]
MGRRIAIYLIGLFTTALGISLIIKSSVGAGPWDAVAVGFNLHFGLTIGMWSLISQGMLVFITYLIERTSLQWRSAFAIMIRSWFLDLWLYVILKNVDLTTSIWLQWTGFLSALIIISFGIGLYVEAKLPKTPVDGLMVAMIEKFHLSLNVARLIIEVSAALIGFLLGGPVGIG